MDVIQLIRESGWDWLLCGANTIIVPPDQTAADEFADVLIEALAQSATKLKGEILIRWKDAKTPYRISASLNDDEDTQPLINQVINQIRDGAAYSSIPHLPSGLLRKMLVAAESENPVSIVRQRDKKQIIINDPMEVALQTPAIDATERIMTGFWRPQDLAYVDQQITELGMFTWHYDAALRPDLWAILESQFERFEVNGEVYGMTTFLKEPEVIPFPEDVLVPQ